MLGPLFMCLVPIGWLSQRLLLRICCHGAVAQSCACLLDVHPQLYAWHPLCVTLACRVVGCMFVSVLRTRRQRCFVYCRAWLVSDFLHLRAGVMPCRFLMSVEWLLLTHDVCRPALLPCVLSALCCCLGLAHACLLGTHIPVGLVRSVTLACRVVCAQWHWIARSP